MPGMNSGLNISNSILVTAFRSALIHQGLVALLILASLAILWMGVREWLPGVAARTRWSWRSWLPGQADPAEPAARATLRIGFGVVWILDGILQAQPAMAAGLPSKVIAPAAIGSPSWVQHLVNWAGTAWSYHPVQAGAATVWIQVGIGIWLLAAARGPWSRLAGVASAGWGLLVWVFGEAFGGIFAPGVSILFGAPGAVVFYAIAGCLVALPDRAWASAALGRRMLAALGLFFAGMALLQAWPGRGFWQGDIGRKPGSLLAMIASMSSTPQPTPLTRLLDDFGSLTASHGFAINAIAVVTLAVIGVGLIAARRRALSAVVVLTAVFCIASWVLVQDLGFLGGLGTDPNSMIPLLLLVIAGYLAVTRTAVAPDAAPAPSPAGPRSRWREQIKPAKLAGRLASMSATGILATWAAVLVLIGAAPMAVAQASKTADPIIAEAIGGSIAPLDMPAPPFELTSANGRPVSLTSLRGKVVLLTFLDPVCTSDCPLIAQELREADQMLGGNSSSVEIVAIAANPLYYTAPYLLAFTRQERLADVRNWVYLTGPLAQLRQVWASYGITAITLPGGQMVAHNDLVFVIDRAGRIRYELNSDPGPGTTTSMSSFATEFTQSAQRALAASGS
jgi:cytochrome oxidase Cu insertion factor (SCO1/SenC/PrrC family)